MTVDVLRILALSTLASSAAIFLILLLRKPLRQRFGAQAGYALWALVPASALVALLPAPVAPDVPLMTFAGVAPDAAKTIPLAVAVTPSIDPMPWLGVVWLLGIIVCAALFLRQQRRFVRALGSLSPDTDRTFRAQTTAGCPALVGAWRPRIVLPADFERRYDSAERELILAHERAHRARGDAQVNTFAAALRCLYWFNPLVHLAASRFRFDQELACDAIVISRFPEARRPYADAMLKTQLADLGLPAGCHWQSSHPLKERIAMLKQPLPGRARRLFGGTCVAAIVAAASFAAWAAQPPGNNGIAHSVPSSKNLGAIELTIDGAPADAVLGYLNLASITIPSDKSMSDFQLRKIKLDGLKLEVSIGGSFTVQILRGSESWRIDGTVQPASSDSYEIDVALTHNGGAAGQPKLIVHKGEPASIRVGDDAGENGFGAQFTFHGEVPVFGPGHTPGVADVSYRRLTRIDYPQSDIVENAQGVVYIAVRVAANGSVADARVDSVLPVARTDLADAALNAVKTWTFNPLTVGGKTAASDTTVAVAFSLDPKKPLAVQPGVLDAIRVTPPQQDDATAAADAPASENVESRLMQPPKYPVSAIKAHEQGKVVLKVHVDANGKPIEALVDKTDPPNLSSDLSDSAIAAAMQWQFNPAHKHGKAVDGWVSVPVDFSLQAL